MHIDFYTCANSQEGKKIIRHVCYALQSQNSCTRLFLYVFVCVVELCQSVLEGLVQKNHVTQLLRTPDSVVQAVVRQGERLCAESDPRKGGYPAGY